MVSGATSDTTYYMGAFEYKNDRLNQVFTEEGRIRYDDANDAYNYDYYLKDHLGNIRLVFTGDGNGNAEALQVNNYYPFGMRFNQAPEKQSQSNDYLYNGKELQKFGLNWYDYGARFYDPTLGRWHSVDPLTENHYNYTPYHYTFNNPILFVDPNGMDTSFVNNVASGVTAHHYIDDDGNERIVYDLVFNEKDEDKKKNKEEGDDSYTTKGGLRLTGILGAIFGGNENHKAENWESANIDGIFPSMLDLAGMAASWFSKKIDSPTEKDSDIRKENSGTVEDKTDSSGNIRIKEDTIYGSPWESPSKGSYYRTIYKRIIKGNDTIENKIGKDSLGKTLKPHHYKN